MRDTGAAAPASPATAAARVAVAELTPGAIVRAEVLPQAAAEVMQHGVAQTTTQLMLRINGQVLASNLPGPPPKAGTQLELVFLGMRDGIAEFLSTPQSAAQGGEQTALSGLARLAGQLRALQAQVDPASTQAAQARATTPVWSRPDQSTEAAAKALAQAVRGSGLFYESHLGAWAQGAHPLTALLDEPQGRLSPLLQQGGQSPSTQSAATTTTAPTTQQPPAQTTAQTGAPQQAGANTAAAAATRNTDSAGATAQHGAAQQLAGDAAPAARHFGASAYAGVQQAAAGRTDAAALAAQLPDSLRGVVQQQLQTLMQGQVFWHGQIWPGQTAEWTLWADPDGTAGGEQAGTAAAPRGWHATLDLDLPRLGRVRASMSLGGAQLDLSLRTAGDGGRAVLDAAMPELRAALQDAGLQLATVQWPQGEGA